MKAIHLYILVAAAVCSLSSCAVDPYHVYTPFCPGPDIGFGYGPLPPTPTIRPAGPRIAGVLPSPDVARLAVPPPPGSPRFSDVLRTPDVARFREPMLPPGPPPLPATPRISDLRLREPIRLPGI